MTETARQQPQRNREDKRDWTETLSNFGKLAAVAIFNGVCFAAGQRLFSMSAGTIFGKPVGEVVHLKKVI